MSDSNPSLDENPTATQQEQTPSDQEAPPALDDEQVRNHPAFKELEEQYSVANREKERYKGRLDRVQKGFEDEPKPVEQTQKEEPQYVTKEELWEMSHKQDIEMYGDDEFHEDIKNGIPRDYALKTAKLRYQGNPDKARIDRQKDMAQGSSAGTRDLESETYEGFNEEEAKKYGYTKETWLKHKQKKEDRLKARS